MHPSPEASDSPRFGDESQGRYDYDECMALVVGVAYPNRRASGAGSLIS